MPDICVEDYLGLAYTIARGYVKGRESTRDTEEYSDGLVGLISAMRIFTDSHESESQFSTLAFTCINNEIKSGLKKRGQKRFNIHLDVSIHLDDCDELVDKIIGSDRINADVARSFLTEILEPRESDSIEAKNKQLVGRHYLDGVSMAVLAQGLGITVSAVQQRISRTTEKLRVLYKNSYEVSELILY